MKSQKHLFSLKSGVHYLNCAYKGPLLKTAEEAALRALERERNPAEILPADFFEDAAQSRSLFGNIVNCAADEVAIIPSTSYGFSSVLNNVKAKPGGNAITLKDEFPSGHFSLHRWCHTHQNELVVVSPDLHEEHQGESWNRNILDAINENTSVVLMSSVHWMNGVKFDLQQIGEKCAAVGARFVVDGTQSVGAMPMDVKAFRIDALVCAAYKWLFGPNSLGLAYMGEAFAQGVPLEESWMNRTNAMNFGELTQYDHTYNSGAGRYNVGETSNFILMPILRSGLQQINDWGVANINAYCEALIVPLMEYLHGMHIEMEPAAYFSGHLFSLRLPAGTDAALFRQHLVDHHISVSMRGEFIRVAVNVFNDEADIQALIACIEETRKAPA